MWPRTSLFPFLTLTPSQKGISHFHSWSRMNCYGLLTPILAMVHNHNRALKTVPLVKFPSSNALRAVHVNSFEAKGCLKSCSIISNLFFSDSQLANKQYLLFFSCCWLNTYRHSLESSALFQGCFVKTLQQQFEGLHGRQLNLFLVWFQLASMRSPS